MSWGFWTTLVHVDQVFRAHDQCFESREISKKYIYKPDCLCLCLSVYLSQIFAPFLKKNDLFRIASLYLHRVELRIDQGLYESLYLVI